MAAIDWEAKKLSQLSDSLDQLFWLIWLLCALAILVPILVAARTIVAVCLASVSCAFRDCARRLFAVENAQSQLAAVAGHDRECARRRPQLVDLQLIQAA